MAFLNNQFVIALLLGIVPSLLWLRFWMREDDINPPPSKLIFITFFIGMAMVIVVLPMEKFFHDHISNAQYLTVIWAGLEELVKLAAVLLITLGSNDIDEPVDFPIFFMASALGFAALENTLFILHPVTSHSTTVSLLTGNLRFLGATLLHATASAVIGISLGLVFFKDKISKFFAVIVGIIIATALHSVFNFFIIDSNGKDFFKIFGFCCQSSFYVFI